MKWTYVQNLFWTCGSLNSSSTSTSKPNSTKSSSNACVISQINIIVFGAFTLRANPAHLLLTPWTP
jgi:hypothetical protein